jgi:hypothetical protein
VWMGHVLSLAGDSRRDESLGCLMGLIVCGPGGFSLFLIKHGVPRRKPILTVRPEMPRRSPCAGAHRRGENIPRSVSSEYRRANGDNGYRYSEKTAQDGVPGLLNSGR